MQGSFLEYAYSVIYSRALPDARDGLKPVQRRILFQMSEMGLRPDRGHVKSARVVGDVMGRLHPHGDTAIYDALVRLSQDFTMRVPLIDGHGNFGSLDDGPAAARYTEARLQAAAMAMTDGLDEDVVDFVPNYDNQLTQPEVLPAAYPNLLVNGAAGIAVGMATNMAPHNLIEVAAAARHLLENPDATLDELMAYVPGPDLPTGGTIVGLDGIKDAYATGRGSFKTRAKVTVEQLSARRTGLVVTELPYLVGPEKVIEKIKDGVNAKKITGISDVTDLTDRKHGLRLVIGIKTGFSPDGVLEQLYRLTPLEDGFSINNVALVDGTPQTLGLRELLRVYLDHRISVVTRRSRYRLTRRQERLHLVARAADRDPRHRRGHPGHPRQRRRRAGARPADRRVRPQRAAGRLHPRAAAAPPHEVQPHRARDRARQAAGRDRRARDAARRPGSRAGPRRRRARRGRRALRHAAAHAAHRGAGLDRLDAGRTQGRRGIRALARDRRRPDHRRAVDDRPRRARRSAGWRRAARARDAPQQARRDPVERRRHHARRARRGHLARAAAALHAGRPAVGAARTRCSSPPARASPTTSASPTRTSACSAWCRSSPSCRSPSARRRASSSASRPAATRRGPTSRWSR